MLLLKKDAHYKCHIQTEAHQWRSHSTALRFSRSKSIRVGLTFGRFVPLLELFTQRHHVIVGWLMSYSLSPWTPNNTHTHRRSWHYDGITTAYWQHLWSLLRKTDENFPAGMQHHTHSRDADMSGHVVCPWPNRLCGRGSCSSTQSQ